MLLGRVKPLRSVLVRLACRPLQPARNTRHMLVPRHTGAVGNIHDESFGTARGECGYPNSAQTRSLFMRKQQLDHIGKLLREELKNTEPDADEWREALTRQLYGKLEEEQKPRPGKRKKTRRQRQT